MARPAPFDTSTSGGTGAADPTACAAPTSHRRLDSLPLPPPLVGRHLDVAPDRTARRCRVEERLGTTLDPDLGAVVNLQLASGDPLQGDVGLDDVLDGLERFVPPERGSPVEALASTGAAVGTADSLPDVLQVIADQARRALRASTVTIGRLDHYAGMFETLLNVGDPGIVPLHRCEPCSEAAWPITIGDSVWGIVIATTTEASRLDHDDLATLRLVATHIAVAVTQAQRIAGLEDLALRDPLTGLGNRRVLEERLRDVFGRPPVDRQDVAVIMCDVDGLKVVNDTEGHAAGDSLLVDAANSLAEAAATVEGSIVCRVGGDEFCIILDGGGMLSAHPVTGLALELFAGTGHNRSLSCGIALATTAMASPGDLLRAADEMQYEEKRRPKGLPPIEGLPPKPDRRRTRRHPPA